MDDNLKPLLQSFIGQMESAMKISEHLADHASSEDITVDHLITGLVYRLMVPMSNDEVTQALSSAERIMDAIQGSDDESEEEDDFGVEQDFGSRKVRPVTCHCVVCTRSRVCLSKYANHDCSDPLADKFKSAIDATCEKHNIYI